jgi:hypothetical protein
MSDTDHDGLRLIVHAGFHKTGTTHLQKTLGRNRAALAPHARLFLREDMEGLCDAARAYSARPEPVELGLFEYEMALFCEALLACNAPPLILMSSEDLAGHVPGRHGLWGYEHAPKLMARMRAIALECLPHASVQFWFTTRDTLSWANSAYAQNVRATRFTMTRDAYAGRLADLGFDLRSEVARIAVAVAPAHVGQAGLDQIGNLPLGPAGAFLAHAGLGPEVTDQMRIAQGRNPSLPGEIIDQMLALNCSDLDDDALRQAKKSLIEAAQQGVRP